MRCGLRRPVHAAYGLWVLLSAACGGASASVEGPAELPPVNREAVRAFTAGVRVLRRRRTPGSIRRARGHFQRALELDPNVWEAHYNLGVLHRDRHELADALRAFEAAYAIQPNSEVLTVALAEVLQALGRLERAAALLAQFVAEHEMHAAARSALMSVERERGHLEAVLNHARRILVRDPTNVDARVAVARVYRLRDNFDVAELVLRKALESDAENAVLYHELGLLELARGDTQAAFSQFARAIELDASFTAAHVNQGSVLLHAGDYAGAEAQYRAALSQDASLLDARIGLGVALRGAGKHRAARRQYERVLEADENHPAALFNLGVLFAEFLDRRPRARGLFQRFLRVAPPNTPQAETAQRYVEDLAAP